VADGKVDGRRCTLRACPRAMAAAGGLHAASVRPPRNRDGWL